MELNNNTLKLLYSVLNRAEICMDDYLECSNELLRLDQLESKANRGDNSMETIARALKRLELEMGFGIKHDENKQQESEREKTTELREGHTEGTISTTT